MSPERERRLLQAAIAVGGLVPVFAGLAGVWLGVAMTGSAPVGDPSLDSHLRYLSGLLLGIGLAFWASLPHIEARGDRVRLLTAIVFIGGLARLAGVIFVGRPGGAMLFGLAMELVVTPAICLWQARVARRVGGLGPRA
jgi:hypothetical protein